MEMMEPPAEVPTPKKPSDAAKIKQRNRVFTYLTIGLTALALGFFSYWLVIGRYREYTDDAYVSGNAVMITAQVPGIVTSIFAQDADFVLKDTPLIQLDTTDYQIKLEAAKQKLAQTVRDVAKLFADAKTLEAQIEEKKAHFIKKAQDFERRALIVASGSVSEEDYTHAEMDMTSAYYALTAVEKQYLAALSQIDNTDIATHPRVDSEKQAIRKAWVELRRCTLYAPATGIIAQRTVQVGKWILSGQPLVSVVPLDQMWVDANFKEVQLSRMRVGQKVHVISDMYGASVPIEGVVAGVGGGTGSVFSLLPPQNATGNWIKIVQRIPVRIDIPEQTLSKHPLRLGLSVEVTVDTKEAGGSMTAAPREKNRARFSTEVFQNEEEGVDQVMEDIIFSNMSMYAKELENHDNPLGTEP